MRLINGNTVALALLAALALFSGVVAGATFLAPVVSGSETGAMEEEFRIVPGASFAATLSDLKSRGLIRSSLALGTYLVFRGDAWQLKPGAYALSAEMDARDIAALLVRGPASDVRVTIPEGSGIAEIDRILAENGVLPAGNFLAYVSSNKEETGEPEGGMFFPDTYRFYRDADPAEVAEKMTENFHKKTAALFAGKTPAEVERTLILASLLEKEVPEFEDRRVVAGILEKRDRAGVALQVDATICSIKKERASELPCYPLFPEDFKIDSSYNTYLYPGFPPAPIANPGLIAIEAALSPVRSAYWYYLSDPETGDTHFSETLEEHSAKRAKYLR